MRAHVIGLIVLMAVLTGLVYGAPGPGNPELDLSFKGTLATASIHVPTGCTICVGFRDLLDGSDRIFLARTIPLNPLESEVQYSVREGYFRSSNELRTTPEWGFYYASAPSYVWLLKESDGSTGSNSGIEYPDISLKMEVSLPPGSSALKMNQLTMPCVWTFLSAGKVIQKFGMEILVSDSLVPLKQFKTEEPIEPEKVEWMDDERLKEMTVASPPVMVGKEKILAIIPVQQAIPEDALDRYRYQLLSQPYSLVKVDLCQEGKVDPLKSVILPLADCKGSLESHVRRNGKELHFDTELSTGGSTFNLDYDSIYPKPFDCYSTELVASPAFYLPMIRKAVMFSAVAPFEVPQPKEKEKFDYWIAKGSYSSFSEGFSGSLLDQTLGLLVNGKPYHDPAFPMVYIRVSIP